MPLDSFQQGTHHTESAPQAFACDWERSQNVLPGPDAPLAPECRSSASLHPASRAKNEGHAALPSP